MHSPHHRTTSRPQHSLRALGVLIALLAVGSFGSHAIEEARADDSPKGSTPAGKPDAEALVAKASKLLTEQKSIETDVVQTIYFGSRKTEATGHYVQVGQKLRLEFSLRVGRIEGKLEQVSDGDELWTLRTVGEEQRLTLRKVGEILKAASASPVSGQSAMIAELGLGGLPQMMAAIAKATDFDEVTEEKFGDSKVFLVRGRWSQRFRDDFAKTPGLKPYTPDVVEVALDASHFPRRIRYLRSKGNTFERLVTLEFRNTKLGVPIDPARFEFKRPTGVFPEDVTAKYLQKLTPAAAPPQ